MTAFSAQVVIERPAEVFARAVNATATTRDPTAEKLTHGPSATARGSAP
jgi:hypothetical protein